MLARIYTKNNCKVFKITLSLSRLTITATPILPKKLIASVPGTGMDDRCQFSAFFNNNQPITTYGFGFLLLRYRVCNLLYNQAPVKRNGKSIARKADRTFTDHSFPWAWISVLLKGFPKNQPRAIPACAGSFTNHVLILSIVWCSLVLQVIVMSCPEAPALIWLVNINIRKPIYNA